MRWNSERGASRDSALGAFFVGIFGMAGCGADASAPSPVEADAGAAGAKAVHVRPSPSSTPSPSSSALPEIEPAPASAVPRVAPPLREAPLVVPSCTPEGGPDEPDDDFADTNCDGIDGDAASAVFVSALGDDDGEGSQSAPVKTLQRAVTLAAGRGLGAVYACIGEYPENVVISAPVSVYGGYDCQQRWKRTKDVAVVNPASGVPLTIRDVSAPLVVDRVVVRAANATGFGESSIAAVVTNATDVSFLRSDLIAGSGKAGANGGVATWPPMPEVKTAASGQDFDTPTSCEAHVGCTGMYPRANPDCQFWLSSGGHDTARVCPSGEEMRGGFGGTGDNCGAQRTAANGLDGLPPTLAKDGVGQDGSTGRLGEAGVAFGSVANGAYIASNVGSDGGWGVSGTAGRGGDGAKGSTSNGDRVVTYEIGGGGGQGGYPGCGGPGGKGGQGGGASIGLLIEKSHVLVRTSRITTGAGGDGGQGQAGLAGEPGQDGGHGGRGSGVTEGMAGRPGGSGGSGGVGGPGGGGPSIGIVHVGPPPTIDDVAYDLGDAGKGPTGALKASDGLRTEIFAFKG